MKKFTRVYLLVGTFASLMLAAGCSSAPKEGVEETVAPVEASANNEAFNSLVNSDPAAAAASGLSDPGAVVDHSSPMLVADAGVQHSVSDSSSSYSAPSASPVNLGASSAGRAH